MSITLSGARRLDITWFSSGSTSTSSFLRLNFNSNHLQELSKIHAALEPSNYPTHRIPIYLLQGFDFNHNVPTLYRTLPGIAQKQAHSKESAEAASVMTASPAPQPDGFTAP